MEKASVTVFLTLMFSCVLLFVSAFFQIARIRFVKASGERMLKSSLDAVLTEYDRELFRDYRFFFLPEQAGGKREWEAKVKEYINEDLNPTEPLLAKYGSLARMRVNEVKALGKAYAFEHKNEAVKHQVYQWMQYEVAPAFLERMKGELAGARTEEGVWEDVEGEVKEAQAEAEYERELLSLLQCVEGVQTNDKGIGYSANGKLKTQDVFAKTLCVGEISASNVGVSHPGVWEALKGKYVNPLTFILKWDKKVKESLKEEKKAKAWAGITKKEAEAWLELLEGVTFETSEALKVLNALQGTGVGRTKESICDVDEMGERLASNLAILQQAVGLRELYSLKGKQGLNKLKAYFQSQKAAFAGYGTKELTFDYSSWKETNGVEDPFASLKTKLNGGVLELVLPQGRKVSPSSLKQADARYRLLKGKEKELKWEGKEIEDVVGKRNGDGVLSFLDAILQQAKSEEPLTKAADDLAKNLLLNEYAILYLKGWEDEPEKGGGQKSALSYEREYVAFGKKSDKENLGEMVNRLLLVRTGANLLHIFEDSTKREAAYAMAAALVGFTCMEALVRLTQISLMVGWAWEEAAVDTAALLDGCEIPLYKNKKSFQMQFSDVPKFGKSLIRSKVKECHANSHVGGVDYRDYSRFFLFCMGEDKKVCRIMDVVQENMKARYREDFDFDSCLFGLKLQASYEANGVRFENVIEGAY